MYTINKEKQTYTHRVWYYAGRAVLAHLLDFYWRISVLILQVMDALYIRTRMLNKIVKNMGQ